VRVLYVVHQDSAGPGVFADVTAERADEVEVWVPPRTGPPAVGAHDAVCVFGGAMNVDEETENPWLVAEKAWLEELVDRRIPVLGLCLGSQLLAEAAGASPYRSERGEVGWHDVERCSEAAGDPLLDALPQHFRAFEWHKYEFPLPPGAVPLAQSTRSLQALRLDGPAWGLQFHAEVVRPSIDRWLDEAEPGEVDRARVEEETATALEGWNEIGRGICRRFLAEAESPTRG
jgi:GMP synthase-like glutamine amidotransferase